jgi:hypothetical protein
MKKTILRVLATCLLAGSVAAQAGTIWINGHEYEVVASKGITWTAARTAAENAGWSLVSIASAEENDFIKSLLSSSLAERSHFWLGATDQVSEGSFQWIDGTSWSFTNWSSGEPNNSGNEDFLAMDLRSGTWAWNDAPDNLGTVYGFARGYVMERVAEGGSVPEPGTLAILSLGLAGLGLSRRCRKA